MHDIDNKIGIATKWSSITEIVSKLIQPISNMILARVLVPEHFGIVASIILVISFSEIFTDAGFQRYVIQKEFSNEIDYNNNLNVAFWTNLVLSLIIWMIIILFQSNISLLIGMPGLGRVIALSSVAIPLGALSSIQVAHLRRKMDFKVLFFSRIAGISIPLVITIPLALIYRSYWALIIGNIAVYVVNAVVLFLSSSWKPKLFYRFNILRRMLSFSFWSVFESISVWLTANIGVLIIGIKLDEYYLGIYKTSMTTVNSIMAIITSATIPVLLAGLSRLQNNRTEFEIVLYKFQRYVSILLFPMGVGIFAYSDYVTSILLGNQWGEASGFIGIWSLMSVITIVFCHYTSIIYISLGKPKI